MREFTIGDIVKVKEWDEMKREFKSKEKTRIDCGDMFFVEEMEYLCGIIVTVTENNFDGINVDIDKDWTLTPNMVHFLDEYDTEIPMVKENKIELKIKKLREDAIIPTYAKHGDSGLDLYTLENCIIKAGQTVAIPTGISVELPYGQEATVRPRSGISLNGCKGYKKRTNTLTDKYEGCQPYLRVQYGTIDLGFRGDIGIITHNQEEYDVFIPAKTKLAQLVIAPVTYAKIAVVCELSDSERGNKGFGSTGVC